MMAIRVNGETRSVETALSVAELLWQLELHDKRIAVELNQEIIPRSTFAQTILHQDDRVEIVHAIGGG